MIKIDFRFDSLILMKPVNVLVLLPSSLKGKSPYKSVLMLHYALADAYTFSEQLNLFSIPDKYGCALIIPSLPNSFFLDTKEGNYQSFIEDELLSVIKHSINISEDVNDSYLLGISMGANAALHLLLNGQAFFSKCALISGFYDFKTDYSKELKAKDRQSYLMYNIVKAKAKNLLYENGALLEKYDLEYMFEKSDKQSIKNMQEIVFCCGSLDALCLSQNNHIYKNLKSLNPNTKDKIFKGSHDTETFTKATIFSFDQFFNKQQGE